MLGVVMMMEASLRTFPDDGDILQEQIGEDGECDDRETADTQLIQYLLKTMRGGLHIDHTQAQCPNIGDVYRLSSQHLPCRRAVARYR